MVTRERSRPASAEQRLKELGIELPAPPEQYGIYVEAVQSANLLFLTGMLPTEGRAAKLIGRLGAELSTKETAKVLDISVAAAKARSFHGRAALRRSTESRAVTQATTEPAVIEGQFEYQVDA